MTKSDQKAFILAAIAVQNTQGTTKWWPAKLAFNAIKNNIK